MPTSHNSPSHAPPAAPTKAVKLPLTFLLTGVLALVIGTGALVARPALLATYHYNQHVIAVTHLLVLGWICSAVMGALYQLVPVALETRLYSTKLGWWHFVFHGIGVVGVVWMFQVWNMKQVGHFGCVFAAGAALFVYNMVRTLWRAPKLNVTAIAVMAALFWISVAMMAGLCIATGKCVYSADAGAVAASAGPVRHLVEALRSVALFMGRFDSISAMHAHAHLGAVGCFTMLIVGVSYKLLPMFTLSEIQNKWRAGISVALLNFSLAGSFTTILIRNPWKLAFAISGAIALGIYLWEVLAILRARKRHSLDGGIIYFLTAVAILMLVALLAVVPAWPGLPLNTLTGQLENLYGFLGLVGAISFAIIGMLYKIVPFLVWFRQYSGRIGRQKVPTLSEMYSAAWQSAGYWTFLLGLAVTCPAILCASELVVRLGCGLIAASLLCLVANLGLILSHCVKPKTQALSAPSSGVLKPA